jgi:hypothetical protein
LYRNRGFESQHYEGCQPDFNYGINSSAVFHCDAQPAGTHVRHVTWITNVKYYPHPEVFQIKGFYYDEICILLHVLFLLHEGIFKNVII